METMLNMKIIELEPNTKTIKKLLTMISSTKTISIWSRNCLLWIVSRWRRGSVIIFMTYLQIKTQPMRSFPISSSSGRKVGDPKTGKKMKNRNKRKFNKILWCLMMTIMAECLHFQKKWCIESTRKVWLLKISALSMGFSRHVSKLLFTKSSCIGMKFIRV